MNDSSKSYVFLHEMRFGIGFGMDSEWIRNSIQKEGFTGAEAIYLVFFLLYAAWVRSRAERPSVSYTKVVMGVAWTGHNLQFTKTN